MDSGGESSKMADKRPVRDKKGLSNGMPFLGLGDVDRHGETRSGEPNSSTPPISLTPSNAPHDTAPTIVQTLSAGFSVPRYEGQVYIVQI